MKLYKFDPCSYGSDSYFVAAESKEQALEAVKAHIEADWNEDPPYGETAAEWAAKYHDAWHGADGRHRVDYYECEEVDPGVVLTNPNQ
jgi:hypothetical protein